MWRCFVAVDIGEDIRNRLEAAVDVLKEAAAGNRDKMSWSRPENWHITLKFLGDVDMQASSSGEREMLGRLSSAMESAALPHGRFAADVKGLITLPPGSRARVVAAGIEDDGTLAALASGLDSALAAHGFERENRVFKPHLTVGRVRRGKISRGLREKMTECRQSCFGELLVDRIVLYRSELQASGSRYTALTDVSLEAGDAES